MFNVFLFIMSVYLFSCQGHTVLPFKAMRQWEGWHYCTVYFFFFKLQPTASFSCDMIDMGLHLCLHVHQTGLKFASFEINKLTIPWPTKSWFPIKTTDLFPCSLTLGRGELRAKREYNALCTGLLCWIRKRIAVQLCASSIGWHARAFAAAAPCIVSAHAPDHQDWVRRAGWNCVTRGRDHVEKCRGL